MLRDGLLQNCWEIQVIAIKLQLNCNLIAIWSQFNKPCTVNKENKDSINLMGIADCESKDKYNR